MLLLSRRSALACLCLLSFVSLTFSRQSLAKEVVQLAIGATAPEINLPGVDGKTYKLENFKDAKLLVVIFTCNHCPTAQAYEERIIKMHADYKDKGVALVAISPNDAIAVRLDELGYTDVGDSFEDMKYHAQRRGFKFPYLYDGETQRVSTDYGVLATPHVLIFDQERNLRYNGRIDDGEITPVKSHDARNAIDALLAGKPVPVEKTRVFGCSTKWADKRPDAEKALAKWNAEPVTLDDIDAAGLKALIANKSENYRLIDVWGTTCAPCIAELPNFVEANRMYRGRHFELYTISIDPRERKDLALELLTKAHVSSKNLIYHKDNLDEMADALDAQWQGPVPYTLLIAPGGEVVKRWKESVDPRELKATIADHLGRTYASKKAK